MEDAVDEVAKKYEEPMTGASIPPEYVVVAELVKRLIPEKLLLSARSVVEAAEVGHVVLQMSPVKQSVVTEAAEAESEVP